MSSFAILLKLARKPDPNERCELCGAVIGQQHQHLIDPAIRKLMCTCDPCSILFSPSGQTKYKRVPRRVRMLKDFSMTEGQWESLMIPIGLAFILENSTEKRFVAMYPGAAGGTESLLSLETWADIVEENPVLEKMEADVEALLVNRLNNPPEYFIVPIDRCYQLVGLIRSNWRGFSGGTEVWHKIRDFFTELKEAASA
jgi:hypothetical protein